MLVGLGYMVGKKSKNIFFFNFKNYSSGKLLKAAVEIRSSTNKILVVKKVIKQLCRDERDLKSFKSTNSLK